MPARFKPRWLSRFRRDTSGVSAIEFALVAMPFFALTFAIIETGYCFFANQIFETAVADTGRLIMTGQAQANKMTAADFKTAICGKLPAMFDCANKVQVDVRTSTSFAASDSSMPISKGKISWTPQFNPGKGGDIVIVRAVYPMSAFVGMFNMGLSNLGDGSLLLMATSAFRNEPFT